MKIEAKKFNKIKYLIAYPEDFDCIKKFPLLIHIHGAGGRGEDTNLLKASGPMKEISKGKQLPFIVVAPQCYTDTWFEIMEQLINFIKYIINSEYIDNRRVYLSGVSMGGYTAFQLAMSCPQLFAAMVILCGGGMYWNAGRLKDIPVWAFHGTLDQTVYVTESINMVNSIIKCGGNAKLTLYPGLGHNCWDITFENDDLYKWLLENNKDGR